MEKIDITQRVQAQTLISGADDHLIMVNVVLHNCETEVSRKQMFLHAGAMIKAALDDYEKEIDAFCKKE